jgi:Zn-dependent protease
VDYSWFVVFALLTWMLAGTYYPGEFKDWPPQLYWFMGAVTAIMLFVSVLLHELGHSVVALRYKIPVRSITLFLFGGVAQIGAEPPSAVAELLIAVAGPVVSLTLAMLFYAVQPLAAGTETLLGLAKYLAYINLTLLVFNLIPGFPLDGGRVFRAVVWKVTGNLRRARGRPGGRGIGAGGRMRFVTGKRGGWGASGVVSTHTAVVLPGSCCSCGGGLRGLV